MATLPSRAERNGDLSEVRRHQIIQIVGEPYSGGDRAGFSPASLFSRWHNGHLKAL
jgi:hypothetical protein